MDQTKGISHSAYTHGSPFRSDRVLVDILPGFGAGGPCSGLRRFGGLLGWTARCLYLPRGLPTAGLAVERSTPMNLTTNSARGRALSFAALTGEAGFAKTSNSYARWLKHSCVYRRLF